MCKSFFSFCYFDSQTAAIKKEKLDARKLGALLKAVTQKVRDLKEGPNYGEDLANMLQMFVDQREEGFNMFYIIPRYNDFKNFVRTRLKLHPFLESTEFLDDFIDYSKDTSLKDVIKALKQLFNLKVVDVEIFYKIPIHSVSYYVCLCYIF